MVSVNDQGFVTRGLRAGMDAYMYDQPSFDTRVAIQWRKTRVFNPGDNSDSFSSQVAPEGQDWWVTRRLYLYVTNRREREPRGDRRCHER